MKKYAKKLLGTLYPQIRTIFMSIHRPYLRKKLSSIDKQLIINDTTYNFVICTDETTTLNFQKNMLSANEQSYLRPLDQTFLDEHICFALMQDDLINSLTWLTIRGYNLFERGIAISKHHRKKGIATAITEHIDKHAKKIRCKYFIQVSKDNVAGMSHAYSTGYYKTQEYEGMIRFEKK